MSQASQSPPSSWHSYRVRDSSGIVQGIVDKAVLLARRGGIVVTRRSQDINCAGLVGNETGACLFSHLH